VDYLEGNGEVMSVHQLGQLPSMTLPEGLQSSEEGKAKKREAAKKKKENSTKDSKAKVGQQKADFVSTDIRTRTEREVRPPNKYAERKATSEEEKEERKRLVKEQIETYARSGALELAFPPQLSSFERMLVHEVAEAAGLLHESQGEGAERRIIVRRKVEKGEEEVKNESRDKVKVPRAVTEVKADKGSKVEDAVLLDKHIICSNCKKNVPKTNFELHQVRCAAQLLKEQKDRAEVDYFNSLQSRADLESSKSKKNKKKKKPQQKENTGSEDDFDSLCEQFQSLDKVCNYTRCKTLVSTLGVTCTFCRIRFCLTHSMAEVHGCGEEARSSARRQVAREGTVNPGSGSNHNRPMDPAKRAQLARRLDKKVNEQEGQRQRKQKEK